MLPHAPDTPNTTLNSSRARPSSAGVVHHPIPPIDGMIEDEEWTRDGQPPFGRRFTEPRLSKRPQHGKTGSRTPVILEGDSLQVDIEPPRGIHHACCSSKDKLITHGGRNESNVYSDVWIFHIRDSMWEEIPTTLFRHSHAISSVGRCLYLYGGKSPEETTKSNFNDFVLKFDISDPSKGWVGIRETQRNETLSNHTAVVLDDKIIFFGGIQNQTGSSTSQLLLFNTTTETWLYDDENIINSQVLNSPDHHDSPQPVYGHTSNLYDSHRTPKILVFGGRCKGLFSNSVYELNTTSSHWLKIYAGGMVPRERSFHGSVFTNGQLIIQGGVTYNDETLSDCFVLNITTSTWREIILPGNSVPNPVRYGHSCSLITQHGDLYMFLHGGGTGMTSKAEDADHQFPGTTLVTIGLSVANRKRPQTAQSASEKRRERDKMNKLYHYRIRRNQQRLQHKTTPPWAVKTSKATTARAFGEAPIVSLSYRSSPVISCTAIDSIVSRLSSTRNAEMVHQQLRDKYLFIPQIKEQRQLSHGEQEEFVDRMYSQQVELQQVYRRNLETKYFNTREPQFMSSNDINNMVVRLNHVPEKKETTIPTKAANVTEVQETVNRLFYVGVSRVEAKKEMLRERYTTKHKKIIISPTAKNRMVDRLYQLPPR